MFQIESKVDTKSEEFRKNNEHMEKGVALLKERLAEVYKGGPEKARQKHLKRNKLLTRDRIKNLFDKNTPFLEFSGLAALDMYDNEAPSAGVIKGV